MQSLAILVINYNGKRYIDNCLRSINKQTIKDFKTYFLDSGSTDDSAAYVTSKYPNVEVLSFPNLGYTGTYNEAIETISKQSTYDIYLLLNVDTILDYNAVDEIIRIFYTKKDTGIVVPAVLDSEKKIDSIGEKYNFIIGTTFGYKNGEKFERGNDLYKCSWASGCCMAIKRKVFEAAGGLDDYFMYYEDVSLSWKTLTLGYEIYSTNSTYVIHYGGGSCNPKEAAIELCEINRIRAYRRNFNPVVFYLYLPFLTVFRLALSTYNTKGNVKLIYAKIKGLIKGLKYAFRGKEYDQEVSLKSSLRLLKRIFEFR